MEVKIGVQNASRELTIDTTLDADGVEKAVTEALKDDGVLALTDAKGRRIVIPGEKLAYVDISTSVSGRDVSSSRASRLVRRSTRSTAASSGA